MARGGLGKWFRQKWVDISRKKKGGGHPACGASAMFLHQLRSPGSIKRASCAQPCASTENYKRGFDEPFEAAGEASGLSEKVSTRLKK